MGRAGILFAIGAHAVLVAGSASAGYIEAVYDLAGSTMSTTTLLGTNFDPLTGQFTIRYDATTASAPLTGARLMAGNTHVTLSQPSPPFLTLVGSTDVVLNPGPGGTPGTLAGATLNLAVVADSSTTGWLHCTGAAVFCGFAGLVPSVTSPITPTGAGPFPFTLPPLIFGTTAGIGNFVGVQTTIVTSPANATIVFTYVGQEISRVFVPVVVPEPGTLSMATLGLVGLMALNWCTRRQRS